MYHAMIVGTIAQRIGGSNTPVFWNVRQSLDDPKSLTRSTRLALKLGQVLSGRPPASFTIPNVPLNCTANMDTKNRNTIVIPNGFDIPKDVFMTAKVPRIFGIAGRFHRKRITRLFFARRPSW